MNIFTIFYLILVGFAIASVEKTPTATSSKTTPKTSKAKTSKAKTSKPTGSPTSTYSATAFKVTSCITKPPTAIPTSSFTITSNTSIPTPITAGLYLPSAQAATTNLALGVGNHSFFYSSPAENAIQVMANDKSSFILLSNGTFELIGPNCTYGVRGKIPMNDTKRDINLSRADRALELHQLDRRYFPGQVQISVFMLDQCENPVTGADPHLICNHTQATGSYISLDSTPYQDFTNQGEGFYTGICYTPDTYTRICSAGNSACDSLGNAIVSSALSNACGGAIAALVDIFSDGLALPATAAIQRDATILCGIGLSFGLNKFCNYEGFGDNNQCPSPQVDLVMSMDSGNYIGKYFVTYDTTSTLATAVNTEILSISTTVTSLAPTCSASGEPLPSIGPMSCPYGIKNLAVTYCESCYNSSVPVGVGMTNFGITCDICCGCCTFAYQPSNLATEACCAAGETDPPCPNDYTCATYKDPYPGTSCAQLPPDEYCELMTTEQGRQTVYDTDCFGPDEYRLFNPNSSSSYTWCDYLGWPYG